jgi:aryl-alcohol dehydrogenase-like predicted oxidoreductase
MIPSHATHEGTSRFVNRYTEKTSDAFYRQAQDLRVSNVGIGTYLGAMDKRTDDAYTVSVLAALAGGINFIDTSLNYRHQRSERSIEVALGAFFQAGGKRDEVVVCTKAGYLVPDAVTDGVLKSGDVVEGVHSLAPDFLSDQLERSRQNLNLETIDVFYVHNPETQLNSVEPADFYERMRAAFVRLERAVSDGLIRYYGTATWNGYRRGVARGALSLRTLAQIAHDIAGDQHHFRFIQLPMNLAMTEAVSVPVEDGRNVLDIATELSITAVASASLLHSKLSQNLPQQLAQILPEPATNAQKAIQFTRSTPGLTVALVGMSNPVHVAENLAIARVPPLTVEQYRQMFR